jgi:hypothetical protein
VALCLDARPVVLLAGLRPPHGALPDGLRGSVVLRGLDAYLRELQRLQRAPTSALWPGWAEEEQQSGDTVQIPVRREGNPYGVPTFSATAPPAPLAVKERP